MRGGEERVGAAGAEKSMAAVAFGEEERVPGLREMDGARV